MKKNFRYTLLLLSMLAMAACDKGFDDSTSIKKQPPVSIRCFL